ncbi:hypothetical protein [Pelistega ratti]|nr:hypothetical protein [Pelistega ratti]
MDNFTRGVMEVKLPHLYAKFLSEIDHLSSFIVDNTGITLYSISDLAERNKIYDIQLYEPNYLLIGQDGDLAFFLKKDGGETIYSNDLGALGSLEMEVVSQNIYKFIEYAKSHYDYF